MQTSKTSAPWQIALSNAVTNPVELLALLQLDPKLLANVQAVIQQFPLRVPRNFIARMQSGNAHDPLLRQVLPLGIELQAQPGFSKDPLNEKTVNPIPGLLHKYHGRVLLTVAGACGVNCRYCFRRHFPYEENNPGSSGWEQALAYIMQDSSIGEVILSGGDPLLLPDAQLAKLVSKIAAIPHVRTLRIHSRMPIVLPERITSELLAWLTASRLRVVFVVHCNHPQEINQEINLAMQELRRAGVTLLNQSVLLQGVNDSLATLVTLSEKLFDAGILPYYLHMLDKVQGAAHFMVAEERVSELRWGMLKQLPGYLVPRFVREEPGVPTKVPVW